MSKKEMHDWGCQRHISADKNAMCSFADPEKKLQKPALLLHSCCGPCSTAVIERLVPDYDVTVFFYNPCITDREEYEKRKENQIAFIEKYNLYLDGTAKVSFIEGPYNPQAYYRLTEGYEKEPEGGARCTICFRQRMEAAADTAKAKGYPLFATTLTVSPHKNYPLISAIGNEIAETCGVEFLDLDFKKKAGFQRSIQMSKEYGLYRQNYCGCEYSRRDD